MEIRALSASLLIAALAACDTPEDRGRDPEASSVFQLVEVGRGVWAMPVREDRNPSQYASAVIVERDDHVLVVDSRHTPSSARSLIVTIRELTPKPVRYLVNTHWHGDHVQGNVAFVEVFPDIEIIGGETIAEDMLTVGQARLDEEIARLDERIGVLREELERLRTAAAPAGAEASDAEEREIDTLDRQLQAMEAYRAERAALELVPPGTIVDDELILDDAEPVVHVIRVGPAHTRGDVVVYLPRLRVLALGDLIEDGFPWLGDGYPSGWADALDRLAELNVRTWLPAHGPVLREPGMFETQRVFMRVLVEEAEAAVARGDDATSIRRNAAFSGFEDHFTRRLEDYSLQERQERYDAFLAEAFARAWAEASGELSGGPE